MAKKIYRSTTDRKLAGLCGGLAEYWDYDSTIIRITLLALILVSGGFFILVYLIGIVLIPEKNKPSVVDKITKQPFEKTFHELTDIAQKTPKTKHGLWLGIGLMTLGSILMLRPLLPNWLKLDQLFLAVILIGGGILIIKNERKRDGSN